MNFLLRRVALIVAIAAATISVWAGESAASGAPPKAVATKDHQAAMDRIAAIARSDQLECDRHTGPAGKACSIQVEGKRSAAEEEANVAFERSGKPAPASMEQQKTAAKEAGRRAKVSYGIAIARIRSNHNNALLECNKLRNAELKQCSEEVTSRTAVAGNLAKATYSRARDKAKIIMER